MLVSVSEFTNSGEGYIATIFIIGAYAAPNPHRIFFLFVAMQKERISAKKEKHACLQRSVAAQSLNGSR